MDFIRVAYKEQKDGTKEFYPSLQVAESQDLVIRGGQFVAIYDPETSLYSRTLSHVADIIDREFSKMVGDRLRPGDTIRKMRVFDNQQYSKLMALIRQIGDMGPELDQKIVFANQQPTKKDAATFVMPYSLSDTPHPAWDEICNTLYSPEDRTKIEWAIGSIFSGDAAEKIQKFYVFFGPPGSGKSTIMNIIEMLFEGHTATFIAADLGKNDKQFSLEPFKNNPLVAIDQDADLSRIESNVNLNLITSHDKVLINAKGKNLYQIIPRSTCFIGSNSPVKITDRKSGLFRRLVDIQPTGNLLAEEHYHNLIKQVEFELGAIANHCMRVYRELGQTYLSAYRSTDMMYRTNDIFNFVQDSRLVLEKGVTLKQAHKMYMEWCNETDTKNIYKQYQFRDLLQDYFKEFHHEIMIDGQRFRSYFMELRALEKFSWKGVTPAPPRNWLELDSTTSLLDELLRDEPAQLSTSSGTPKRPWDQVTSTLKEIPTDQEHFTKVPTQMIVIDFDLKNERGEKDLVLNLAEAAHWPQTYAEVSKSGQGLHLHYFYDGDVEKLASVDPEGRYEVKVLLGNSSLRRKLTLCNDIPVAVISSGLPLKEEKVLSPKQMSSERGLREQILRCLTKQHHGHTKPEMDFIAKILDDAQKQGMAYDISDMWDDILQFALGSDNQKSNCIEIAMKLPLKSEIEMDAVPADDKPIVDYDLEVYSNLFVIGWMYDDDPNGEVVKMLNPSAAEVQEFIDTTRRIGYNNRGYDAHILWAASMGASVEELYRLSQRIIQNDRNATYVAAYKIDYMDLYDIASEKKSLKKWEIELGLPHKEMDLPWDQPVPKDRIQDVLDYLENDVRSTQAVGVHLEPDINARKILAELTGMELINTNRQLTEKLIFGDIPWDVKPDLVYTDLKEMFKGYEFDQFAPGKEKSTYRGYKVGEGGWVDSDPGMYENVVLLDVASMHPTSIVELNAFGQYTPKFKDLLGVRLAIKAGKLEEAATLYDGKLAPYLGDKASAKRLSDALKIVVNSVYGLTAASFPNKFRDDRNIDNIVAKRGALFMVDVKEYVNGLIRDKIIPEDCKVVHIKTDSIKISCPSRPERIPEIVERVSEFGTKYGYTFEHEATYSKFCLVNDAVYIARYGWHMKEEKIGKWEAVGAQFQHPVVFKTLFSKEDFEPNDYVEVKQVQKGAMYLVSEDGAGYKEFIGRFGAFVPVHGGRTLLRIDGDKEVAVAGTKGYLWETDDVALVENTPFDVDFNYFQELINAAAMQITKYGDYESFVS